MEREVAALTLHRISLQKTFPWTSLLERFSTPQGIIGASDRALKEVLDEQKIAQLRKALRSKKELEEEWKVAKDEGIQLVDYGQDTYPPLLKEISPPPFLLYCKGDLTLLQGEGLAVIGSRRASAYGLSQARRFASPLSEMGLVIVSGLAMGIDGAVHRAVLDSRGKTTAVIGSGLLNLYPKSNGKLAREVAEKGLLLSEFPLKAPPLRHHFPWRNRIISGLCRGVVVIEAGKKSGTLITVRWALDQNREVFALPGPVDLPTTLGTHGLIQQGARLVTSPLEILTEVLPMIDPGREEEREEESKLQGKELEIYEALGQGAHYIEELESLIPLSLSELWGHLLRLEMKGRIKRLPGNYYSTA